MAKETAPQTSWIEPSILAALEAVGVVVILKQFFNVLKITSQMYWKYSLYFLRSWSLSNLVFGMCVLPWTVIDVQNLYGYDAIDFICAYVLL